MFSFSFFQSSLVHHLAYQCRSSCPKSNVETHWEYQRTEFEILYFVSMLTYNKLQDNLRTCNTSWIFIKWEKIINVCLSQLKESHSPIMWSVALESTIQLYLETRFWKMVEEEFDS